MLFHELDEPSLLKLLELFHKAVDSFLGCLAYFGEEFLVGFDNFIKLVFHKFV